MKFLKKIKEDPFRWFLEYFSLVFFSYGISAFVIQLIIPQNEWKLNTFIYALITNAILSIFGLISLLKKDF